MIVFPSHITPCTIFLGRQKAVGRPDRCSDKNYSICYVLYVKNAALFLFIIWGWLCKYVTFSYNLDSMYKEKEKS